MDDGRPEPAWGSPDDHARFRSSGPYWTKRWRVKAYDRAFVIEPNLIHWEDPFGQREGLKDNVNPNDLVKLGPPQLILMREKLDGVEIPHSSHLSQKPKVQYGRAQCVIQMDAFLGILHIKAYRFLVLVVDSNCVGSLPPDCSPLGVVGQDEEPSAVLDRLKRVLPTHRHIYAAESVVLLPFHIPSNVFLGAKLGIDLKDDQIVGTRPRSASGEGRGPRRSSLASKRGQRNSVVDDNAYVSRNNGKRSLTPSPTEFQIPQSDSGWYGKESMDDLLGDVLTQVLEVEKTLTKRTFFFSYDFDLTRSLQRQYLDYRDRNVLAVPQPLPVWHNLYSKRDMNTHPSFFDIGPSKFVWNASMVRMLWEQGLDAAWVTPIIQGSVASTFVNIGDQLLRMIIIGRRSAARGGTRYFARGVNEAGDVANFCESEFLACLYTAEPDTSTKSNEDCFPSSSIHQTGGGWFSFLQIRGSVPLFWEQNNFGINPAPKVTGSGETNLQAFVNHQKRLEARYGKIHYLDLLSDHKQGEVKISDAFQVALRTQRHRKKSDIVGVVEANDWTYRGWDFHNMTQQFGFEDSLGLFCSKLHIADYLSQIGHFHTIGPKLQDGIFRTNCLDCLDRTNVMQWFLCQRQLIGFLQTSPAGAAAISAQGIKYNQELYSWLIRQTDDVTAIGAFAVASRQTRQDHSSQIPRSHPLIWNPEAPLRIPAPFPNAAAYVRKAFYRPHESDVPEYRVYFVGGWTEDLLNITYYRPRQNNIETVNASAAASKGNATASRPAPSDVIVAAVSEPGEGRIEDGVPVVGVPIGIVAGSPEGGVPMTYVMKDAFSSLWSDLGDLISAAYTGTGSVLTPLMKSGKSTLLTNITHWKRTVGRLYKHNFEDKTRQESIDIILGLHRWSLVSVEDQMRSLDSQGVQSAPRSLSTEDVALPPSEFELKIWTGTWNVAGGAALSSEDLTGWMRPKNTAHEEVAPFADVYAVCLQELVDLSSSWTLLNQVNRTREAEGLLAVRRVLSPSYTLIGAKTMIGVHLSVWIRSELVPHVTEVELLDAKMGLMGGQIGNKGAVALRFRIFRRSWCFVTAHLAPDKGNDKSIERLNQIEKILALSFPLSGEPVEEHDYIFMGGDFNFPAMAQITEIEKWLEGRNFEEFLKRDQLNWLREKETMLFRRLTEAPVAFWPTYKYKKGTSQYDRRRPPSWCDRVLYGGRSLLRDCNAFHVYKYDRVRLYFTSDHKPVFLSLKVSESIVDTDSASRGFEPATAPLPGERTLLDQ